jgi:cytochrome P450
MTPEVAGAQARCPVHTSEAGSCPFSGLSTTAMADALDPFGAAYLEDPYHVFAHARHGAGAYYNADIDYWIVTDHAQIKQILRETKSYSADNATAPAVPIEPSVLERLGSYGFRPRRVLADNDPPNHVRVRRQVNRVLNASGMLALEDDIRELAREHIDAFADEPEVEFVSALAWPLPALVLFRFFGIEAQALDVIKKGSADRARLQTGRPTPEEALNAADGLGEFWTYCRDLIADRTANPRDDFPSDLIAAGAQVAEPLEPAELVTVMFSILFAGHETTTGHLTHLLARTVGTPGVWQRLRENRGDEALFVNTVEEALRIDAPVIGWRRRAKVDVTVGATRIPADARILLMLGSGNHDDEVFNDPEVFDIDRSNARANLTFGNGEHLCLGAPLARLEGRVVLEEMVDRFAAPSLPEQAPEFIPSVVFRVPAALQITLTDSPNTN